MLSLARSTLAMVAIPPRVGDVAQLLVTNVALGVMASLNECLAYADASWLGLVIPSTGTVEDPVGWEMDW